MVRGIHFYDPLHGNSPDNFFKGKRGIPLIVGQCPACPVFLTSVSRILGLYPIFLTLCQFQNIVCQFHAGHTDDHTVVAFFKPGGNPGGDKQGKEIFNIVFQVIDSEIQHASQSSACLVQIGLIVSVDHWASSPRP